MITDEELKQLAKNEERLWDMAAITAVPTLYQMEIEKANKFGHSVTYESAQRTAAFEAYNLADILLEERKRRFLQGPDTSGVSK